MYLRAQHNCSKYKRHDHLKHLRHRTDKEILYRFRVAVYYGHEVAGVLRTHKALRLIYHAVKQISAHGIYRLLSRIFIKNYPEIMH